jgi:hypothetical protein
MAEGGFDRFLAAFPPGRLRTVDSVALASDVRSTFGVEIPPELIEFWTQVGCGAFADGELYFFGRDGDESRESLAEWNSQTFWRDVFPAPTDGGPLFFAETCFGDQIGFRHRPDGACVPVLFVPATVELFVMAPEFGPLFAEVLTVRDAVTDPEHLAAAKQGVGPLPSGQWYCPIVSPLVGGTAKPDNYMVMSPKAFVVVSIAEWRALGCPNRA